VGVIMSRDDEGAFTTSELVVRGLDWVLGLKPSAAALNLSFGGPRSAQIERALRKVLERMPVAAAAGNEGQRGVSWPAAYEGVIAVTALDANRRRWPRANTGEQVAIAAPGVEVWTVDGAGQGRYSSGTSVATLFVTAALAASVRADREEWLRRHTREAGTPGRDPEYGHGLLGMNDTCSRTQP
jgi:Subtilase family